MTKFVMEYKTVKAQVVVAKITDADANIHGRKVVSVPIIYHKAKQVPQDVTEFLDKLDLYTMSRKCEEIWFPYAKDQDFIDLLEKAGYSKVPLAIDRSQGDEKIIEGWKKVVGN